MIFGPSIAITAAIYRGTYLSAQPSDATLVQLKRRNVQLCVAREIAPLMHGGLVN